MPCPFFEPREPATATTYRSARLPLIEEHDGMCHLHGNAAPVPSTVRFGGCNHGNIAGVCSELLSYSEGTGWAASTLRFNIRSRKCEWLEVQVIEEADFAPIRWTTVWFDSGLERCEPEQDNTCRRAQIVAFCRSYLRRQNNGTSDAGVPNDHC